MPETQDNAMMRFLNEKLVPFSTKVAQNRYIQAIGQGAMGLMAIILVGSIFNLLNTLLCDPYQAFLASSGLNNVFQAIYDAAMNYMGLFMVASVARGAAKSFGHEELTIENMFLALMAYLILVPLTANDAGDSMANLNYLGSRGAFMAFLAALVTTKIHIAVVERGLTIKMPAGVPDSVGKTFTAIIPGFFTAVAFGLPLMYNFTFIIPFMLTPILSLLLAYGAIQTGLMPAPTGIIGISSMPTIAYGIMQGSWKIAVYQVVATLMSAAIWFPFFKVTDAQALAEEQNAEPASAALEN